MIKNLLKRIRDFFNKPVLDVLNSTQHNVDIGIQTLLKLKYKELAHNGVPLPSFDEVGFQKYSGSNEDGILLYIFSLIGTTNKKVVDIGAAGIDGSNVANLIINHGWIGLLIDANEKAVAWARKFYKNAPDVWRFPPKTTDKFVTTENINSIISSNGFTGEIDLLSIDIDGVDYWIWKAIDSINPRVVVIEYQDIIGSNKSLTVPYQPDFDCYNFEVNIGPTINYAGASLPAFVKLAKTKGYRLVGCSRYGINAFFIRSDIGDDLIPEVSISTCFEHPRHKLNNPSRWAEVKDMNWVEV